MIETGVVVKNCGSESVFVRPDGRKTGSAYHQNFWERIEEDESASPEALAG